MAQKYYNVKDAAEILGISEDEVRKMQEQRELYGYRDGADWKFKAEEIERVAATRPPVAPSTPAAQDSSEELLLSEVELGQSSIGASGTVIGMEQPGKKAIDSDLSLASDSEIHLASDIGTTGSLQTGDSQLPAFEELDLTLEEDVSLEDSSVDLQIQKPPASDSPTGTGSSVVTAKPMEDDDMVLGSGSAGSGLTLGGDSGISLVDPHDSGLSLEEPLEIVGSHVESLELGEDDMLSLAGSKKGPGSSVKGDDDFLLTPMEDTGDADESESGSQVIALDTEGDDASTMIASAPIHTMGAMLDEDIGAASSPSMDFGSGVALGGVGLGTPSLGTPAGGLAESAAASPAAAFAPEMPYTPLQITGLICCTLVLMLSGMMMFDMVRNIWSWDGSYSATSSLMEFILNLPGIK
jgi:excisionase family DNA binding protein